MVSRSQEHLMREGRETADGVGILVPYGPNITGNSGVGEVLTRVAPVVRGVEDPTIAYQWMRDRDPIVGQTGNTYTQVAGDLGKYISLRTVISADGVPSVTRYAPPILVSATEPDNTVAPAITGTPTVGQTLTVTNGTWGGYPVPTYTRVWRRDGVAIEDATATTYELVAEDEGAEIDVVVTATNTAGAVEATSNTVGPVAAA